MPQVNGSQPVEIVIEASQSLSGQLRQAMVHRIAGGVYPTGSRLPSIRHLARSLGVNHNTVAKVYRQLAREKIVQTIPGKGVFVLGVDARGVRHEEILEQARKQVTEWAGSLLVQAQAFGWDQQELLRVVLDAVHQAFRRKTAEVAFVECNTEDAHHLAQDLELHLNIKVIPVVLDDLATHLESNSHTFDVICTTYYHLGDVKDLVPEQSYKIVPVQIAPRPEQLLRIAQYRPEDRLALVANNQRTLDSLVAIVRSCSRASVTCHLASDSEAVKESAKHSDAIVDTLGSHEQAVRLVPEKPKITLEFYVHAESVRLVSKQLLELPWSGSLSQPRLLDLPCGG